jgi:hypothetical protein
VLVHELLHVVFGVLESRGIRLCRDTEETYTYTAQHLFDTVRLQQQWELIA